MQKYAYRKLWMWEQSIFSPEKSWSCDFQAQAFELWFRRKRPKNTVSDTFHNTYPMATWTWCSIYAKCELERCKTCSTRMKIFFNFFQKRNEIKQREKIPSKLEVAPHALKMWTGLGEWIPLRLLRLLEHLAVLKNTPSHAPSLQLPISFFFQFVP